MREMTGSGIFAAESESDTMESGDAVSNPISKTSVRICQVTFFSLFGPSLSFII